MTGQPDETERPDDDPRILKLFEEHRTFADQLARRYSHGKVLDDDLRQVAQLGLLLACRRFDPDLGRFLRFASMTIVGELKKHLRSHGWSVHVPRSLQEDSITVSRATERLTQRLKRPPRVGEIAADVGLTVERVTEAVRAHAARFRAPLDGTERLLRARGDIATTVLVWAALDTLDPDERELITMRFEGGMTQREIGERLGVSQPEAHRRLTRSLDRLRRQLDTPREDQRSHGN